MYKSLCFLNLLLSSVIAFSQSTHSYKIENNELITESKVVFYSGKSELKPESEKALNEVKNYLNDKSYISLLRIESHVASGGNENSNLELTKKRAIVVAQWLIKNGVDPTRLIAVYFGSSKPVADNSTPEGKAANNRINFINAALKGRPIGGMPVDGSGQVACYPCKE